MGHLTKFELSITKGCDKVDVKDINDLELIGDDVIKSILSKSYFEEGKWYSSVEDMKKLALSNPEYTFYLSGVGEEFSDFWKAKFKYDKFSYVEGQVVFPEHSF